MEKKFSVANNGQQVIASDLDIIGETAALADDRVLAELFRLNPYNGSTVARGIVPHGSPSAGYAAQVAVNGATGSVLVNPFRAVVGSRTAVGTDAKANLRDVRSSISVGSTTLGQAVSLAANASGNPRWDLIYAGVSLDASDTSVTRKIKNPTTKVIAGASVTITKSNATALAVVAGTPAANPTLPTIPPDAGSIFYIPIAFVRVPDGFTAGSTVETRDIAMVAPILSLSHVTGGCSARVANSHNKVDLSAITATKMGLWGANSVANFPKSWVGSASGVGTEQLIISLNLTTGSETHVNGAILDDTRDWRRRICKWWVATHNGGSVEAPWLPSGGNPTGGIHSLADTGGVATTILGMGNTFLVDTNRRVLQVDGLQSSVMADGTYVGLDVDSSGRLVLNISGAPNCGFLMWVEFSGPFPEER